jgi:hypothetical protein
MASTSIDASASPKAARSYTLVVHDICTNWHGAILPAEYKQYLQSNCIIRVVVQEWVDGKTGGQEAIYLKLDQVKDNGDLVGRIEATYRLDDANYPETGDQVIATRDHINEIPLEGWQPEEYLEAVKHLKPAPVGYAMTGLRGFNAAPGGEGFETGGSVVEADRTAE